MNNANSPSFSVQIYFHTLQTRIFLKPISLLYNFAALILILNSLSLSHLNFIVFNICMADFQEDQYSSLALVENFLTMPDVKL